MHNPATSIFTRQPMSRTSPKPLNIGLTAILAMAAPAWMVNAQQISKWDEMFIPYNGMDPTLFGPDNYPYTPNDPLRQHFHLLQTPSKSLLPKPVYFYSHANNGTADSITRSDLTTIAAADYSVISWESVSKLGRDEEAFDTCWADFELLWEWFQDNAAVYDLDPNNVVIGGRSRGSVCSWPMAHSRKPGIKGLYMYNALPNGVWNHNFEHTSPHDSEDDATPCSNNCATWYDGCNTCRCSQNEAVSCTEMYCPTPADASCLEYVATHDSEDSELDLWEEYVTVGSPPAYLVYGPECEKPIEQDCEPSPDPDDKHNSARGQTIVERYDGLGIGLTITLTDGLTNNNIGVYDYFEAFVDNNLSPIAPTATTAPTQTPPPTTTPTPPTPTEKWDEMFIPYNDMNPNLFGPDNYPYTPNDPLRQHFHLLQTPSKSLLPKPVYFYSHPNGNRAENLKQWELDTIVSADYSVISWESVTKLQTQEDTTTCWADFELFWDWFQKNAALYNLDPNNVVIGGRSRGSVCSWPMAHSRRPGIKGLYMYNALPNAVWKYPCSDVWVDSVTVGSPPAYLVYGPECRKPIEQDCETDPPDGHNPARGQTIVERYDELGIGSRITLTDGLTNNQIEVFDYFKAFVGDSLGPIAPTAPTAPTPTKPPTSKPPSNTNPPSRSTPSSCPTRKKLLEINVQTDDNGDEIKVAVRKKRRKRWRRLNDISQNKFESNALTTLSRCVNPKHCYLFNIVDKGKDGLCCDKGEGSYSFVLDGKEIHYSSFEGGKSEKFRYCKNEPPNLSPSCGADKNCGEKQYCTSADVCLDHTTCRVDEDCLEQSNLWMQIMCAGPITCNDGSCSKRCDRNCKFDKDCGEQQYCGGDVCLDHTTCRKDNDCLNPSNMLATTMCLGPVTCEDSSCNVECEFQMITTP